MSDVVDLDWRAQIAPCGHVITSCACSICRKTYAKIKYQQNKQEILERNRIYRIKNREKIAAQNRLYKLNNKEKIRQWEKENREKRLIQKQEYRLKNRHRPEWHIKDKISHWRSKYPLVSSDLTSEYLCNLLYSQENKCYYTGEELSWGQCKGCPCPNSASLDRLEPHRGYVQGNVVWCTFFINTMKGNLSELDYYKLMKRILTNKGQISL